MGFIPHPRQRTFLECGLPEALYGGTVGCGKSECLLADAVRHIRHKAYRGLLLRRRMPDLRHLISKSYSMYLDIDPGAKFNKTDHTWTFSTGAEIQFGYLEQIEDKWRYHGQEYQFVGWDELTQHPESVLKDVYIWMFSRLRAAADPRTGKPFMQCFMRATSNPGGPGHSFVKKRFVDPCPEGGKPIRDRLTGEMRMFVKAYPKDNPTIWADPGYRKRLMQLPLTQRKALLDGDWNVAEGAVFVELDPTKHYVDGATFDLPVDGYRWFSIDWGFSTKGVALWHLRDHDNNIITYREHVFRQQDPHVVGRKLREIMTAANENITGILDAGAFAKHDGPSSVADAFWREGVKVYRSDHSPGSRMHGLMEMHTRLSTFTDRLRNDKMVQIPAWRIFNTCRDLCRNLPILPYSTKPGQEEDVDSSVDDHSYDAARYGIMHSPMSHKFGVRLPSTTSADEWERRWETRDPTTGY